MKKQIVLLVTLFAGAVYIFGMEKIDEQFSKRLKLSEGSEEECPEPAAPAASAAPTGESTVKFLSSDDQEFEVTFDLAKRSETIKHMFEDIGEEGEAVPLPITGKTLDEVVNALEAVNQNAVDERLKKLNIEELVAFINAVNYLDIPDLLDVSIKKLAELDLSQNDVNMLFKFLAPAVIENLWAVHPAQKWMLEKWGENTKELQGYKVTFSPDGKYLVSFPDQGTIKIWDVNNNFEQVGDDLQHRGGNDVIFSPNGRYLVSRSYSVGGIKIWDVNNNFEQIGDDLRHQAVFSFVFSPDGRYLVSRSHPAGVIKIWDVNNNFEQVGNDLRGDKEVIFSPDGGYLISLVFGAGVIKIWDVNNNFEQIGNDLQHQTVDGVVFSPDGKYLVSRSSMTGVIKIWDMNNNFEQVGNDLQHLSVINTIFSPDGRYLVSWSYTGGIKIWDVNNNFEQIGDDLQPGSVFRVIFSLDGKYLISFGGGVTSIWDVNNNFEQVGNDLYGDKDVIFSPDGRYLVLCGKGVIRIWDVNNNFEQVGNDLQYEGVGLVSFSLDGRYLISSSSEEMTKIMIKIWDMNIFRQIVNPTFDQIKLCLLAYFNVKKEQGMEITNELKVIFNNLPLELQVLLPGQFREKFKDE